MSDLSTIFSSGALSAALVFLLRNWISERIKTSIQHEYDQKLETHKAQLKSESEIAIEKFKSELQVAAAERNFRFSHVFQRTADVIAEIYRILIELRGAVESYTDAVEVRSAPGDLEVESEKFNKYAQEFSNYFNPNRIYIPRKAAEKVWLFATTLERFKSNTLMLIVHDNQGTGGGDNGNAEHFAGMHQNRVHRADGNNVMPLDAAARIQKQHGQTFTLRVKVGVRGNVHPPIISGLIRRLALLQAVRGRTLPQGGHFVFIRAGGKLKRFHQRFKSRKTWGRIHGRFSVRRFVIQPENTSDTSAGGLGGYREKISRKGVAKPAASGSNGIQAAPVRLSRSAVAGVQTESKPTCRQPAPIQTSSASRERANPKLFRWAIHDWQIVS